MNVTPDTCPYIHINLRCCYDFMCFLSGLTGTCPKSSACNVDVVDEVSRSTPLSIEGKR